MNKIAVTGHTGMIGRSLIELLTKKYNPKHITGISLDKIRIENIQNMYGDITDCNLTDKICEEHDIVYHLAGIKGNPDAAINRPASFFLPMLQFNTNIIRSAHQFDIEHILYTSSVGVYAPCEYFTEGENDTIPSSKDWYAGWAKRTGEMCLEAVNKQYEWNKYSIIRPANVYGPFDNFDPKNAMVIPSLIHKMIEYPTQDLDLYGDGSNYRDFIYCKDVARAMIFMVDNKLNGPMNIGSGISVSIEELVELLKKLTNFKGYINWLGGESGDKRRIMNVQKIKSAGFELETSLEEGLVRTIDWYKENKNLLKLRYDSFS